MAAAPSSRVEVGRRLRAARFLADAMSLRDLSAGAGLTYSHLQQVEAGSEPLTETERAALGELLHVPAALVAGRVVNGGKGERWFDQRPALHMLRAHVR
ncbi:MAG: helix-turn-helix transcriptional regulator [Solirubrobacterales bacterium]|nr:helix-turn-helix transcriptional regulator [Solirubrobacterales bacterium]